MIHADRELAQRLERAEARANADFIETRARLRPDSGACWIEVGGAYAMFDGVDSPCTQTFGLGMFEPTTNKVFDEIEEFFFSRGAATHHEISPLADQSLMSMLIERGYRPIEQSNLLFLDLSTRETSQTDGLIVTRVIADDEVELWARTSAAGWATEHESLAEFIVQFWPSERAMCRFVPLACRDRWSGGRDGNHVRVQGHSASCRREHCARGTQSRLSECFVVGEA